MQKIAILDFGGQYTHLIARRVRQLGIYSDIHQPEDFSIQEKEKDYKLIGTILSGGPQSVKSEDAHHIGFDLHKAGVPILGICYGYHLIASMVGGVIEQSKKKEYGFSKVECDTKSTLFRGLVKEQTVWMSHGDHVEAMPEEFIITSSTDSVPIASYESKDGSIIGVQFHPEVTHTENGMAMLDNFISICTDKRDWQAHNYKDLIVDQIREEAGGKKLFLLLSGGVDSLVALRLCLEAVGKQRVYPLHIDTGYMRKDESQDIIKHFERLGFENLMVRDAEDVFLENLKDVADPEKKRQVIGRLFVEVMHEELDKLDVGAGGEWMLVQGTIYPDTIESGGTKKANLIKTHHNRVPEIEELITAGKVIEPLKELYKDEVREVGRELGLPGYLIERHPFPGPGLAIRIICSPTDTIEEDIRKEEPELNHMTMPYGLTGKILPVRSVGVQGDFRTYHHPAVVYHEGNHTDIPGWQILKRCASIVINNLTKVNRVIYSTQRLVEELHLGICYPDKHQADLLREVDALVLDKVKHIQEIWQIPVVSLPLWDKDGGQCFVMRPVTSRDAMTADVYPIDFDLLDEIVNELRQIKGAGYLFYDITSKPPATIEWE
jgi:GMP synthase (glutamine-hydrolysing)